MQVKIEDQSSVEKKLSFEVPPETVTKELDKAYGDLKKKADIKGFRKGKIPRKVLENRFADDVYAEVGPKLIQEAFEKALNEHGLKIVGNPKTDPPALVPGQSYCFDIVVEVKPEIEDVTFEGIDLKKSLYTVADSEVDAQLYMVQKGMATKQIVSEERPVKEDDYVCIDYEGTLDGQPYEHTPLRENYVMGIGRGLLPAEFSEKLVGAIPVQKLEIPVEYDADYHDENLAGKTIVYNVTLKEIQEEILPELNDELAKKMGQFQTLDEMKTAIRENLENGCAQRIQHELSEQVFTHLLGKYEFEVPQSMVDAELEGIIAETEQMCAQNNLTLEAMGFTKDSLKAKYHDVAEKQVRRHLILDKIIVQEQMELSKEEMEEGLEKMARDMKVSLDAVKNYFKMDSRQLDYYIHTQLEKKAVDLIIAKGNVTEVDPDSTEDVDADNDDQEISSESKEKEEEQK